MIIISDTEDFETILLDQLVVMRYSLADDGSDDWFLGGGKRRAEEVTSGLEAKLVGSRDVIGLKNTFDDIRRVFRMPDVNGPSRRAAPTGSPIRKEMPPVILDQFPEVPTCPFMSSFSFRKRNSSFDLDEYIADISYDAEGESGEEGIPPIARRKSSGADTALTMMTTDTLGRTTQRASLLSSFTIREATREWHAKAKAVAYHTPRKAKSLYILDLEDYDEHVERAGESPFNPQGWSRSKQDLLDSIYSLAR